MSRDKRQQLICSALLAAAVFILYGRATGYDFVWDDRIFFIGKEAYRNFSLGKILFGLGNGVEYLPARDITYALDYFVWGERAAGFHLTNILLFAATAILLFLFTRRFLQLIDPRFWNEQRTTGFAAFAAALFFAVHPINCEAVSFVTCRNVLVSGLFFIFACYGYVRSVTDGDGRNRWYLLALCTAVGAVTGKATAVVLPLILTLVALYVPVTGCRKRLLGLFPFFLVAGGGFLVHRQVAALAFIIDEQAGRALGAEVAVKLAKALQIPFFYLGKLLLPVGYSAEYDVMLAGKLGSPAVLLAAIGSAGILAAAVLLRRRFPELTPGLLWFMITLIPVLNLFNTNPVVADRYAFLPSYGIFLAAAVAVVRFVPQRGKAAAVIVCALSLAWGGVAAARSGSWRSDETLWRANTRTAPRQSKGYINLANWYYNQQQFDKTMAVLAEGQRYTPLDPYLAYFEGMIAEQRGDLEKAKAAFRKTLDFKEDHIEAIYQLATIYERTGDIPQAAEYYSRAVLAHSIEVSGLRASAGVKRQELLRKLAPAFAGLEQRVAASPGDMTARGELALQYDRAGFYDEAMAHYKAMESAGYRQWPLYFNMGNSYLNMRKPRQAAEQFEKCLALNPGNLEALNGLGISRKQLAEYPLAIRAFEQAIRQDGNYPAARFNLGKTYLQMGDKSAAVQIFKEVMSRYPLLAERSAAYVRTAQEL